MMTVLFVVCIIWGVLLLALTIVFDVWVYVLTRNFDFVLKSWMNRHKAHHPGLSEKQKSLLRLISMIERGLGYFGLFVLIPMYVLAMIYMNE